MEDNAKTIINVAGDYVQSKHVDYEINNIKAGGIGIQFVNGALTPYTLHHTPYILHRALSKYHHSLWLLRPSWNDIYTCGEEDFFSGSEVLIEYELPSGIIEQHLLCLRWRDA